ncbi:MAG: CoA-transferase [Parvibaculaceae bacterium]
MEKLITAEQAARLVPDGATISIPGNASMLVVDRLLAALEERFLAEGRPQGLTAYLPCNAGLGPGTGVDRFAHKGLLKRYIASAFPIHDGSPLARMILDSEIEAYNFPMGVLYALLRDAAAGRPGLLTEVGKGTYVDPAMGGGRMNAATREDLVMRLSLDKDYLFYKAPAIDVTFLKATTADEKANLGFEREPLTLGALSLALAAKNNGGIVVAQVERIAARGSIHPKNVVVPGNLVDAVVLAPDAPQSSTGRYEPAITGETRAVLPRQRLDDPATRAIMFAAAARLRRGWTVNLGVGTPANLPILLAESGLLDELTLSTEHGGINGFPNPLPLFGAHTNPEAILDPPSVFDMYDGGGLDATLLGMAQADAEGNVNVSRFAGRLMGCGGFIDITHRTRTILFCGTLTAGGTAHAMIAQGLSVTREGRVRKLVKAVDHLTFNGRQALERGQNVFLVTERGVFQLDRRGWLLVEVVAGIDPQRDIAAQIEFEFRAVPSLRVNDAPLTPVGVEQTRRWIEARGFAEVDSSLEHRA